jgi:murein L,D-transpeptidase YafK
LSKVVDIKIPQKSISSSTKMKMENQVMKFGKALLFLVKKEKRLMRLVLKKSHFLKKVFSSVLNGL